MPDCTVCIVEDEEVLRDELAFQLRQLGFSVETFDSAPPFYRYLATRQQVIAVLDIGLPGEDGLSICEYLRSHDPHIGIVFMSARGLHSEQVAGLEAGADAYLVKPIDVEVLVLILHRLTQRIMAVNPCPALQLMHPAQPQTDAWVLNDRTSQLIAPNGLHLRLSLHEFRLVQLLLQNPGEICSHAALGHALGGPPETDRKHRIEVILSRLKARARRQIGMALPIHSERGYGYRMLPFHSVESVES